MKKIHLYDFDGTIYKGDTTFKFYLFCVKRNPFILIYFPYQILFLLLRFCRLISDTAVKQAFISFMPINEKKTRELVKAFSESRKATIFTQVAEKIAEDKKDDNNILICISASPRPYIETLCMELGFDFIIATEVSKESARKIVGKNCRGSEKVLRLKKLFIEEGFDLKQIESMISDSKFDKPLYDLAKDKYVVDEEGNVSKGLPEKWMTFF